MMLLKCKHILIVNDSNIIKYKKYKDGNVNIFVLPNLNRLPRGENVNVLVNILLVFLKKTHTDIYIYITHYINSILVGCVTHM